jgi:hypothetical protein
LCGALRAHGQPLHGRAGIFKATRAEAICTALGITHETIERGKPWQSYIETTFGIQRRMVDWEFANADTWVALQHVHDRWVDHYDHEEHWAHRHKKEGRRTPGEVLGRVMGTPLDLGELARLFRPVRFSRWLDRAGYVRFRRWRLYGERGLPKQGALVWLSEETLTLGYGEEPLRTTPSLSTAKSS